MKNLFIFMKKKKLRFDIFNEMVFLVVKNFLLNCNGDVYFLKENIFSYDVIYMYIKYGINDVFYLL